MNSMLGMMKSSASNPMLAWALLAIISGVAAARVKTWVKEEK